MSYELVNSWPVTLAMFVAFWVALGILGFCALRFKDKRGRLSVAMLLAIMTAVAIICVFVKMGLTLPPTK